MIKDQTSPEFNAMARQAFARIPHRPDTRPAGGYIAHDPRHTWPEALAIDAGGLDLIREIEGRTTQLSVVVQLRKPQPVARPVRFLPAPGSRAATVVLQPARAA